MARLRLFGPAREAAGTALEELGGTDVAAVLGAARDRYGQRFADVLARSAIWVNGEPAGLSREVGPDDEVAVLPPVSGG